jgi:hypothetical protein
VLRPSAAGLFSADIAMSNVLPAEDQLCNLGRERWQLFGFALYRQLRCVVVCEHGSAPLAG